MKKLLLLFLAVAGMVTTASAAKIYINVNNPGWWANDYTVTAISFDGGNTITNMDAIHKYGIRFRVADIPEGVKSCKIYRHTYQSGGQGQPAYYNEQTISFSGTEDIYKSILNDVVSDFDASTLKWSNLTLRQNIIDYAGNNGNTWDATDNNFTSHPDDNTFTFVLTKAQIDNSSNKAEGIRFRLRNGDYIKYNDAGSWVDGYPQIYPNSTDEGNAKNLSIAGNVTEYYQNTTNTDWFWQVSIPDYDYEKIVITAKYINDGGYKWLITADAFITKTITDKGVATFGCAVPVDFSKAIPATEGKSFMAKKGVVNGKTISWTEISTLDGGKGALLEGDADTYSIPVAVSGDATDNDFVAITSTQQITETMGGKYAYILTEVGGKLGFYKPADNGGSWCAAGTAYLATGTASARGFFPLWDDATAIEAAQQEQVINGEAYNLAGQRVAQPSKGLYIVNGKKVILK